MTKPPIESVGTLAGRELDAALQQFFYGFEEVELYPIGWLYRDRSRESFISANWHSVPRHSASRGESFFAMVERVAVANKCIIRVEGSGKNWTAMIWDKNGKEYYVEADTLPLAFARAALLTTYPVDEVRRMQA